MTWNKLISSEQQYKYIVARCPLTISYKHSELILLLLLLLLFTEALTENFAEAIF